MLNLLGEHVRLRTMLYDALCLCGRHFQAQYNDIDPSLEHNGQSK